MLEGSLQCGPIALKRLGALGFIKCFPIAHAPAGPADQVCNLTTVRQAARAVQVVVELQGLIRLN